MQLFELAAQIRRRPDPEELRVRRNPSRTLVHGCSSIHSCLVDRPRPCESTQRYGLHLKAVMVSSFGSRNNIMGNSNPRLCTLCISNIYCVNAYADTVHMHSCVCECKGVFVFACICLYVRTCICMFKCMYVCMYMRMYMQLYVSVHMHMYVHMCLHMCMSMPWCISMYTYMRSFVSVCVCVYICMHACMHACM